MACGSNVKLDDVPVESRTATSVSNSGAVSGDTAARAVAPVQIAGADAAAAGPVGIAKIIYFDYDSYVIKPEFKSNIESHARYMAANKTRKLAIEGHTDDRPVQKGGFPSNWELSSARAAAVARYFIDEHGIDPRRVTTTGYAAFRPVTQSDAPAERARNRRVEIVVLADGEFVESQRSNDPERELGRLLEKLPPIDPEIDETLRPPAAGPAPFDLPRP